MQKKWIIGCIIAAAVMGLVIGATADDSKEKINQTDEKGKITDEMKAAADVALAGQLAEYGRRTKNPMAMITAAQMMKTTPAPADQKPEKTTEGTGAAAAEKPASLETPEKLLADAQAMAKEQGNDALASLAEKESKLVAQRGRVGGGVRHVDRIQPGATDTYALTFKGGEQAIVAIVGDGDCDLDLYVYDQNNNLIGSDTDRFDQCLVTWTPSWTGKFYIKIKNHCRVYADYILASN